VTVVERSVPTQLAVIADELGPLLDPGGHDAALGALCELGNAVFGSTACSIAALDEPASELVYRASAGPGSELIVGLRLPLTAGIAGFVASTGQAIAVDDVRRDPRFAADVAASTGYVPTTILVVPVTVADALVGVVSILDRQRASGLDDLDRAAVVAEAAAPLLAFEVSLARAGRVLLRAAADAADGDLAAALRRAAVRRRADETDQVDQEVAAMATALAALRRLPAARRAAAATAVSAVVALAESGSRRIT
jgi:GAF domain-containing protein